MHNNIQMHELVFKHRQHCNLALERVPGFGRSSSSSSSSFGGGAQLSWACTIAHRLIPALVYLGMSSESVPELDVKINQLVAKINLKSRARDTKGMSTLLTQRDALCAQRDALRMRASRARLPAKPVAESVVANPQLSTGAPFELEPVAGSVTESVAEPVTKPAAESVAEPVAEQVSLVKDHVIVCTLIEWGFEMDIVLAKLSEIPDSIRTQTVEYICSFLMQTITEQEESKALLTALGEPEEELASSLPAPPVMPPSESSLSFSYSSGFAFAGAPRAKAGKKKRMNKKKKGPQKPMKRPGALGKTCPLRFASCPLAGMTRPPRPTRRGPHGTARTQTRQTC